MSGHGDMLRGNRRALLNDAARCVIDVGPVPDFGIGYAK